MKALIGDVWELPQGTFGFTVCSDGIVHIFKGRSPTFPQKAICSYEQETADDCSVPKEDDNVCETCYTLLKKVMKQKN